MAKTFRQLVPAYGRDYKSKKAVQEAIAANKDFVIANIMHPDDGRYANCADLKSEGYTHAMVRYGRLTKIAQVPLKCKR
jgi:hypothetical protein